MTQIYSNPLNFLVSHCPEYLCHFQEKPFPGLSWIQEKLFPGLWRVRKMGDGRESLVPRPNFNRPVKDLVYKDLLTNTFTQVTQRQGSTLSQLLRLWNGSRVHIRRGTPGPRTPLTLDTPMTIDFSLFLLCPIQNGVGRRSSDIVLVGTKDESRRLEFQNGETFSEKPGSEFSIISYSRTELIFQLHFLNVYIHFLNVYIWQNGVGRRSNTYS